MHICFDVNHVVLFSFATRPGSPRQCKLDGFVLSNQLQEKTEVPRKKSGSRSRKIQFLFKPNQRKGLILEYGRERPADQCQIVCRVEMWYTSKDIGPFSTWKFTYQLENEV